MGALNRAEWGKFAIFRPISPYISETVGQGTTMVVMVC